jgi:ADP-heptose:LPS heptosyltransferase
VSGPGAVLALRALGLGDLLTALPALRGLRAASGDRPLLLAVTPWLAPLARALGVADGLVPAAPLAALPVPACRVAVAVNLHGRGPESHCVLQALRPARLIAHGCAEAGVPGPPWEEDVHEVERWCRMLAAHGVAADRADLGLLVPPGPAPRIPEGATVVHPGASVGAKRWPGDRFAAVAASERRAGRAVVVTGGPGEEADARRVARAAGLPPEAVLAGRTDPLALARVVAGAGRLVCGDTGVAHLAVALGTPSVALFGPVPPAAWGPPPDRPWHTALWGGVRSDPRARTPAPGLLRIGVEEVLAAIEAVDAAGAARRPLRGGCPDGVPASDTSHPQEGAWHAMAASAGSASAASS